MPKVTLNPVGHIFEVPHGSAILDGAREASVWMNNECGGNASCGTCAFNVLQGQDFLEPIGDVEENALSCFVHKRAGNTRLACQTHLKEGACDIVIEHPLVGSIE